MKIEKGSIVYIYIHMDLYILVQIQIILSKWALVNLQWISYGWLWLYRTVEFDIGLIELKGALLSVIPVAAKRKF